MQISESLNLPGRVVPAVLPIHFTMVMTESSHRQWIETVSAPGPDSNRSQ